MINIKEDKELNTLNHSCAHLMAQAVKHLYPNAKFWVGPVRRFRKNRKRNEKNL